MTREVNIKGAFRYVFFVLALILGYSFLFHLVMVYEGREYSWVTGLYWTLTTMSTLGFGDIVFQSDLGKVFSIVVILSGLVFLVILLPFVVVRFVYLPWLEMQSRSKVWGSVSSTVKSHVVLIGTDPIVWNLIGRLKQAHFEYYLLEPDASKALGLQEMGWNVLCGALDDVETYSRLGVGRASLVVVLTGDVQAATAVFTVREFSSEVKIVANVDHEDSLDLIALAGADQVFHFSEQLGRVLARRAVGMGGKFVLLERFGGLVLAELPVCFSGLEGRSLAEADFRAKTGLTVVGVWMDGEFRVPSASEIFSGEEILLIVGKEDLMTEYAGSLSKGGSASQGQVLVLGGGRVGMAVARELALQGVDYCIVDKGNLPREYHSKVVRGSASDREVLEEAGLFDCQTVVITTHTDDLNVFLTIYCRKLCPNLHIVGRATRERNVGSMYRAGANVVMSYASLGAMAIFNYLTRQEYLLVSEGLCFRVANVPPQFFGLSLEMTLTFRECGVSLVGVERCGAVICPPLPNWVWKEGDKVLVVGTVKGQDALTEKFL